MLPNNDDEAQNFLHNPQEPNTQQFQKKALKKVQQSKTTCESFCYFLQCIVLLLLIVLVIKFALLVSHSPETKNNPALINSNNPLDELMKTDPNDDDFWDDENYDALKLQDQDLPLEDQNMLKFLLNPEESNTLQQLLDDAEELFEELEFEAQPLDSGWQFKNGLKLIVKEDTIEQRILLIINNGFDDDLQSQTENMRMSMQLFQKQLSMCESELIVKSFESVLVLRSKNETDCLKLLSDSLYAISFNQEDIEQLPLLEYEKIDLLLDVILQAAQEPDQLNDAQQLEQYFEQTLQQSLVKIVVESTLSNQEVYMAVSDTKLLEMKFGKEAKQMNLDQLLFNLIKLNNPDEYISTLVYPIQMNEPFLRFFLFWLRAGEQFTILESENLVLQFQTEDCYGVAQRIYSFASFMKRQPEKQMIQLHKDYYNLHVLMHDIDDEAEFQKKQLHHLLDLIQSGVVIIQEGPFIYDPQSKTISMDQFFESKIVNKKFQNMNYGYQLFDYTQVGSVNEDYVSHLKLPSLSKYIPINYNILQLYTAQELVIPQYSQKEIKIVSGQLKQINTNPTYSDELITPIEIEFSNSKSHPMVEGIPIQIGQDLWWQFNQGNKVFMGLQIHCNQIYELSQLKAMFKISQQYLEKIFEQHEALFAGFSFTVESNLQGLNIIISGWKGTFNIFRDEVIHQLRHMQDQELFNEIQQELVQNFKKYYNEKQQFYLLQYLLPKLMLRPVNDPQEIIQQLTNTKLEDLQKLFNNITYTSFISGNVDPNYIKDSFADYSPNSQVQLTKTLKLDSNLLSVQQTSQNTLLRFYSGGQRNSQNIRKLLYIQEYFEKNPIPFTIRYKSLGCVDGLVVYATSQSNTPAEMEEQFETIIQQASFNYQSQNFLKNEEYLWDKILYRNYDFNSFFEETEFLEEDIKNVFEWKSLTIYGYSNKNKSKEKSTYNESSQVEYFECEYAHQ